MSATLSSTRLAHQTPFVLFWLARLTSSMGVQMLTLVIAWRVYQITNSALDLGLIGLIQFVPAVVFTLLVGHIADSYDRRLIVRGAQSVNATAALIVMTALLTHMESRNLLFAAAFLVGSARSFEAPTSAALVPGLVPAPLVPRAVGAWTSANQTAVICGPALGGLIYAASPVAVGTICVAFFSAAVTLVSFVRSARPAAGREPPSVSSVLAGFDYIRTRDARRLDGVRGQHPHPPAEQRTRRALSRLRGDALGYRSGAHGAFDRQIGGEGAAGQDAGRGGAQTQYPAMGG